MSHPEVGEGGGRLRIGCPARRLRAGRSGLTTRHWRLARAALTPEDICSAKMRGLTMAIPQTSNFTPCASGRLAE